MSSGDTLPKQLLYEGSVKRVWQSPQDSHHLWFEFTDDYSVFDWGKMPDTIKNKGRALTLIGAFFFERLADAKFWQSLPKSPHLAKTDKAWLSKRWEHKVFSDLTQKGVPSHFRQLFKDGDRFFMDVHKARVDHPVAHRVLDQKVYIYPHNYDGLRLVPLEIVFRFGMPEGSSLKERLSKDPDYAKALGLKHVPTDYRLFEHPVLEFFTKLEPKDRLLSMQEAALLSGLSAEEFESMTELALDIALALNVIFAERKVELWDGKIELIARPGELMLADSIGPDELRLLYEGCHLSKEMIRKMYRNSPWEEAIRKSQSIAKFDKRGWKEICVEQLKATPEPLTGAFKQAVDNLYGVIANHLTGEQTFQDQPSLDEYVRSLPAELLSQRQQPAAGSR